MNLTVRNVRVRDDEGISLFFNYSFLNTFNGYLRSEPIYIVPIKEYNVI